VGLTELFIAVLIAGISCINLALPALVWHRSGDGRFLALAGANGVLAVLGAVWTWGQLPVDPPGWTGASIASLGLVLIVALLLLVSTLWPRRA
jgi:hypothetical protein